MLEAIRRRRLNTSASRLVLSPRNPAAVLLSWMTVGFQTTCIEVPHMVEVERVSNRLRKRSSISCLASCRNGRRMKSWTISNMVTHGQTTTKNFASFPQPVKRLYRIEHPIVPFLANHVKVYYRPRGSEQLCKNLHHRLKTRFTSTQSIETKFWVRYTDGILVLKT